MVKFLSGKLPHWGPEPIETPRKSLCFGYTIKESYPVWELAAVVGKMGPSSSRNMKVFERDGFKCVRCGCKGKVIAKGQDKTGATHWNLYTEKYFPLTVDHILPKSLGGSNRMENLQTMCYTCNLHLGNKLRQLGSRNYVELEKGMRLWAKGKGKGKGKGKCDKSQLIGTFQGFAIGKDNPEDWNSWKVKVRYKGKVRLCSVGNVWFCKVVVEGSDSGS